MDNILPLVPISNDDNNKSKAKNLTVEEIVEVDLLDLIDKFQSYEWDKKQTILEKLGNILNDNILKERYNIKEDADIGVILFRLKFKIEIMNYVPLNDLLTSIENYNISGQTLPKDTVYQNMVNMFREFNSRLDKMIATLDQYPYNKNLDVLDILFRI